VGHACEVRRGAPPRKVATKQTGHATTAEDRGYGEGLCKQQYSQLAACLPCDLPLRVPDAPAPIWAQTTAHSAGQLPMSTRGSEIMSAEAGIKRA
jgi:hypothetical protein